MKQKFAPLFLSFTLLLLTASCGLKGPLYQTPPQPEVEQTAPPLNSDQEQE